MYIVLTRRQTKGQKTEGRGNTGGQHWTTLKQERKTETEEERKKEKRGIKRSTKAEMRVS